MVAKLTVEQAETLVAVAADGGFCGDVEIRESYSGRGMYGARVVAFVTDDPQGLLVALGAAAAKVAIDLAVIPTRTDAMGLRTIVY